jgi:hypothetical protein
MSEIDQKLDDLLQQSGVKGMRWGVRHDEHKALNPKPEKASGKIKKKLDSLKRERDWGKALKEVHNMPTKDIRVVTNRVKLENSMKTMAKSKMATKKDKEDYLNRHNMSNEELARKIARLQAKDDFHKAVNNASKEQREIGVKAVQFAGTLGVKAALNKKIEIQDVNDAWNKSKDSYSKAQQDAVSASLKKFKGGKYANQDKAVNEMINTIIKQAAKSKS